MNKRELDYQNSKRQQKRDTVGKISSDLLIKADPVTPTDQMREMLMDWDNEMAKAIEAGRQKYRADFFIHVETKKERLMQNVLRNYFIPRMTCPTPNYDQTVFKYHYRNEILEFLWTVPARDICKDMKENVLQIPPEQKELLGFVLDFADGTLFKMCKKLNNEEIDSTNLIKE